MLIENLMWFNVAFYFIIGACFGSFINAYSFRASKVVPKYFYRLDKQNFFNSLIGELKMFRLTNKPKFSHCMSCGKQLKWYHNIPLLSYIFLLGKCGYCKTPYSSIYFLSEVFLGILFSLAYYFNYEILMFDNNIYLHINFIMLCFSLTILYSSMIIDLKTEFIPDYTIFINIIPFIYISNFINNNFVLNFDLLQIFNYLIVPIIFYYVCYGIVYLIWYITTKKDVFGNIYEEGKVIIGMGDIKLLSLIMIIYGLTNTIIIYFISAYIAIVCIILLHIFNKKKENNSFVEQNKKIPYGIYIFLSFITFEVYKTYIFNFLNLN